MRHCVFLLTLLACTHFALGQTMQDAAAKRDSARQRAQDRIFQSVEKAREKTGISRGLFNPPPLEYYNRVMQAERTLRDRTQSNVSDNIRDVSRWNSPEENFRLQQVARQEALQLYPQLADPGSAFSRRCREVVEWMQSQHMPVVHDARLPLIVSHIVSLEQFGAMRQDAVGIAKPEAPKPVNPDWEAAKQAMAEGRPIEPIDSGIEEFEEIKFSLNDRSIQFPNGTISSIRDDLDGKRKVDISPFLSKDVGKFDVELPQEGATLSKTIYAPDGSRIRFRRVGDNLYIRKN